MLSWVLYLADRLMKAATDEWGTIDILVNVRSQLSHSNTGIGSLLGPTAYFSRRLQLTRHTMAGMAQLPA